MPIEKAELMGGVSDSEASSDSDQDVPLSFTEDYSYNEFPARREQLRQIIIDINNRLRLGQAVDLSLYPPLFVVHFRGIHFFKQFFIQAARREVRHNFEEDISQQAIYSPAVYELAGLRIGERIDTDDKKRCVRAAIKTLNEKFDELTKMPAKGAAWYGNQRQHANLLHRHYQRYVNNYKEFREESEAQFHECYKMLTTTSNPYISSADEARHAVLYALGGKTELTQGCLRPGYGSLPGKVTQAKHPKTGYVQIFFHKLQSLRRNNPLFLSALQAANKLDIKERLLNERETTFKSWIAAKHIVYTKEIRFPSFNVPHDANYHRLKYGMANKRSYNNYREMFNKNTKTTNLLDSLAEHYTAQLTRKAAKITEEKGGFIVYLGLDGLLRETLPTTQDISTARSGRYAFDVEYMLAQYQSSIADSDSEEELVIEDTSVTSLAAQLEKTLAISLQDYFAKLDKAFRQNLSVKYSYTKSHLDLVREAARRGFVCVNVPGDGSCFYHALLHQLQIVLKLPTYETTNVDQLITIGINEVINNIDFYVGFSQSGSSDELVNRLLKPGTWADNIMIQALANALQLRLEILQSDGQAPIVVQGAHPTTTVHLGYEIGLHYQSLIQKQNGVSVDEKTQNVLVNAAKNNIVRVLQSQLAARKELVNIVDNEHHASLLMWSLLCTGADAFHVLLTLGANPALISNQGRNALHYACRDGKINRTKILLQKFPYLINQPDFDGNTPLHLAVRDKQTDMVRLLCSDSRVIRNIQNLAGETPLNLARRNSLMDIINLLCLS